MTNQMQYFIAVSRITREPYVKYNIDTRIRVMQMDDRFGKVFVPCYENKILYPGYIFVEMDPRDDVAYYLVDRTPGVISILGNHQFISKLEMEKVETAMMFHSEEALIPLENGDTVVISDGSLKDIKGTVVGSSGHKVTVTVNIFGRPTKITTDLNNVNRIQG